MHSARHDMQRNVNMKWLAFETNDLWKETECAKKKKLRTKDEKTEILSGFWQNLSLTREISSGRLLWRFTSSPYKRWASVRNRSILSELTLQVKLINVDST